MMPMTLRVANASPVQPDSIEITAEVKELGLSLLACAKVRVDKFHVHDLIWTPFRWDDAFVALSADSLRDNFA